MVVICYIMGVPMISIHHTDNFVMCVAMIRNLGVMLGDNLCQFGDIMRDHTGVGRRDHAHRQSDGQHNS